jgi:hypothetical protein
MFRSHQGFQGVVFLRNAGDCLVITLWDSPAAIDALEASSRTSTLVERGHLVLVLPASIGG